MFSPALISVTDTGYFKTVVPLRQFGMTSFPDFVAEVIYDTPVDPMLRRDTSQSVLRSFLSLSAQPQPGRIVYTSFGDFYLRVYLSPAGSSPPAQLPVEYSLLQNFPNPFNPSTTIVYDLPEASHVRLAVFDMLGRQVLVLKDENEEARRHTVVFDASRLSAGVYFYRISTPNFSAKRKRVFVR